MSTTRWLAMAAVLLGPSLARAQPATPESPTASPVPAVAAEPEPLPTVIVSIPVMALSSNALAVQAERPLFPHASVVAAIGWRDGADGTYQSNTFALGAELRFWLNRLPKGLFAGPRIESSILRMSRDGSSLGTAMEITEGLVFGYRLVLFDHAELSMVLGYGLRHDLPTQGVPGSTRATPLFGFTVGWVFD
jgi:hypothetical protein